MTCTRRAVIHNKVREDLRADRLDLLARRAPLVRPFGERRASNVGIQVVGVRSTKGVVLVCDDGRIVGEYCC